MMQTILPGFEATEARATDVVLTPDAIAADVVGHFRPTGRMLDPCRGAGAFWKHMPEAEWCECREGRDFFAWYEKVDWIVSNPPYSNFGAWMRHSLEIADNMGGVGSTKIQHALRHALDRNLAVAFLALN